MSEIDIFRDFKDYACDECVENYDECDDDDCWAKIMYKQLKRLQAENEELKETNLQLQTIDMEIDRYNKYRKALEEIREIITSPGIPFPIEKLTMDELQMHTITSCENKLLKILSKINEVLKEGE